MPVGFVSDEEYAAIPGVRLEFRSADGTRVPARSTASGAVLVDLRPGDYEVCIARRGFGSKRVRATLAADRPVHFRLLSDRLLGYAWPKWCRGGDVVEWRVHATRPYHLSLWRYGREKELVRPLGWFDNHGPRAATQTVPDGWFVETGVRWHAGSGVHRQRLATPERSGLYFFHARTEGTLGEPGEFFAFPLVVAPRRPGARVAVVAATNTWNAYNPFGGRSNYLLAARMADEPVVNAHADLPRYRLADYGEWTSSETFAPLSFDRPEPHNHVPETTRCPDPIAGRQACHLAPAEWRVLGWLEREGFEYDLYADAHLHDGTLDLDAYRVVVLGPHPEYASSIAFRRLKGWVFGRGGRLAYLGGNGLNCAVAYSPDGTAMTCDNRWPAGFESRMHAAAESEAALLGVVYDDRGAMGAAPVECREPDHWAFAGLGLRSGAVFGVETLHERCPGGASGHETDKRSPATPAGTVLLARGLNPDGGGAEVVTFTTPSGGAVFSAGSITWPAALWCDPVVSGVTANMLRRFLQ
jgi:hypothetical protein